MARRKQNVVRYIIYIDLFLLEAVLIQRGNKDNSSDTFSVGETLAGRSSE